MIETPCVEPEAWRVRERNFHRADHLSPIPLTYNHIWWPVDTHNTDQSQASAVGVFAHNSHMSPSGKYKHEELLKCCLLTVEQSCVRSWSRAGHWNVTGHQLLLTFTTTKLPQLPAAMTAGSQLQRHLWA